MLRRVLIGSTTGLTLLFVLPILLIRAQPYHGGHLSQFFSAPPDCPAPCFMGVRPQHTTVWQALGILRANDAVDRVQVDRYYPGQTIYWRWTEAPHDFRGYAFQSDGGQVITSMTLPGNLTLGDVALALGPPEHMTAAVTTQIPSRVAVVLDYPSRGLYLLVNFYPCEVDQADYWNVRQEPGFASGFTLGLGRFIYGGIRPDDRLDLDPAAWAKQVRDFCKGR